ncbi:MAG: electron transfer flavoprotein subunit alpha/FixB family protein [Eubacteriaceae bacterium]
MTTITKNGIFVFAQQEDSKLNPVTLELIGEGLKLGHQLGTKVTAVLLGHQLDLMAKELLHYGANSVLLLDDQRLENYMTEPYTYALSKIVEKFEPDIMLFGATALGRDLAPRVSARCKTGLTADCTSLEIDESNKNLKMTRPAFGGNIMATIVCPNHRPQMATIRPGVMEKISPIENPDPMIEAFDLVIPETCFNVEILDVVKSIAEKMDITEAKILISGGRGLGSPENFKLLEDLGDVLGGTTCASRACVDAGWVEKNIQVGQTGKTVRPNLYIACGISGAIQHVAGMEDSELIIAINKDETAPIFDIADFSIVGDVTKILPLLTQMLKEV